MTVLYADVHGTKLDGLKNMMMQRKWRRLWFRLFSLGRGDRRYYRAYELDGTKKKGTKICFYVPADCCTTLCLCGLCVLDSVPKPCSTRQIRFNLTRQARDREGGARRTSSRLNTCTGRDVVLAKQLAELFTLETENTTGAINGGLDDETLRSNTR